MPGVGGAAEAAIGSDGSECLARFAAGLRPAQRQLLAGILEAARILDAHGDQAGLDQLFADAPALLRMASSEPARRKSSSAGS